MSSDGDAAAEVPATTKPPLSLNSINGAEPALYPWPLTVGKGATRGAEDEHDQANEIVDTIR